jgi:hypothetical protein
LAMTERCFLFIVNASASIDDTPKKQFLAFILFLSNF